MARTPPVGARGRGDRRRPRERDAGENPSRARTIESRDAAHFLPLGRRVRIIRSGADVRGRRRPALASARLLAAPPRFLPDRTRSAGSPEPDTGRRRSVAPGTWGLSVIYAAENGVMRELPELPSTSFLELGLQRFEREGMWLLLSIHNYGWRAHRDMAAFHLNEHAFDSLGEDLRGSSCGAPHDGRARGALSPPRPDLASHRRDRVPSLGQRVPRGYRKNGQIRLGLNSALQPGRRAYFTAPSS